MTEVQNQDNPKPDFAHMFPAIAAMGAVNEQAASKSVGDRLGDAGRIYLQNRDLFDNIFGFIGRLFNRRSNKPTGGQSVPPNTPLPTIPPPVIPQAPAIPASGSSTEDADSIRANLFFIQDRNGRILEKAEFDNIQNGGNIDDDSRVHTNADLLIAGQEVFPGDPRWDKMNHSWPNGAAVFPYYEADGKLTSILHGDQGTDWVEPQSVADDHGCTVTFQLSPRDNRQHTFRFGYYYRRHDGRILDTGLIGRGNVVNGQAFTVR